MNFVGHRTHYCTCIWLDVKDRFPFDHGARRIGLRSQGKGIAQANLDGVFAQNIDIGRRNVDGDGSRWCDRRWRW